MDALKYHISYQFKTKFEKLNKYSLAYNFFMDIGIANNKCCLSNLCKSAAYSRLHIFNAIQCVGFGRFTKPALTTIFCQLVLSLMMLLLLF